MHFSMFDADTTRRLVGEAAFTIERTAVEDQIEGQVVIPYTWILARRPLRSPGQTDQGFEVGADDGNRTRILSLGS
jgi:hypothetical protein